MSGKSKNFWAKAWVQFACRLIIGGSFILASANKIFYPEHFRAILAEYHLLPEIYLPLIAIILPWIEFICGILLVLNIFALSNAVILLCLLLGYTGAITINLIAGLNHDCGCFDILGIEEPIGIVVIIRDLVFIGIALPLIAFAKNVIIRKKEGV